MLRLLSRAATRMRTGLKSAVPSMKMKGAVISPSMPFMPRLNSASKSREYFSSTFALGKAKVRLSSDARPSYLGKKVEDWTVNDVAKWAEIELKLDSRDAARLRKRKIDGLTLLLPKKLQIPGLEIGPLSKLHTAIEGFTEQRRTAANLTPRLLQKFESHVKLVMTNFKFPDIEARQKELIEEQKQQLQSFYKEPLVFNPLVNFDLRFMQSQVDDPIYQRFSKVEQCKESVNILRAVTAAGKTATILNAIGRNAFLLYTECQHPEALEKGDYNDAPFSKFHRTLFENFFGQQAKEPKSQVQLTYEATVLCQGFWLTRLILLHHMIKMHSISPEEWLFWTNNGGQQFVSQIQALILQDLQGAISEVDHVALLADNLETAIPKYLNMCEAASLSNGHQYEVWLAVDEAQFADNMFNHILVSQSSEVNQPASRSSLLRAMLVYALPASPKRVVAGTRMSNFSAFVKSGALKGNTVYDTSAHNIVYPYVSGDEAWEKLSHYFDFSDISKPLQDVAKYVLQGRLRYVFGFIRSLGNAVNKSGQFTKDQKDQVFLQALTLHIQDIRTYIDKRYEDVVAKLQKEKYSASLISSLNEHIVELLMASFTHEKPKFSIEEFEQKYLMSPEDTGFLLFVKQDEDRICYMIKEPLLIDLLMAKEEVQKAFYKTYAKDIQQGRARGLVGQIKGYLFENAFLFALSTHGHNFLCQLPKLPDWCKPEKFKWKQISRVQEIESISEAVKLLSANINEMKNYANLEAGEKDELITKLQSNSFLKQHPQLSQGQLTAQLATRLVDLVTNKAVTENVQNELLFFEVQPLDILIKPTTLLGSDGVGFYEYKNERIACLVALSLWEAMSGTKFAHNEDTLNPANFYTCYKVMFNKTNKKKKAYPSYIVLSEYPNRNLVHLAYKFRENFRKPSKTLRISATIPSVHMQPKIEENSCTIFMDNSSVRELHKTIADAFEL